MMFGRIDQLIRWVFSVLVRPILNVAIVSVLLHWCLADQYSVSALVAKLDVGGTTQYLANVVIALFSGNFDALKELASRYSKEIAAVSSQLAAISSIVAIVLFILIVVLMFVLDRAIYSLNWLVPLDYEFDVSAYGNWRRDDARMRRLYSLLGQPFDFPAAVGVVRSFLGEHSVDAFRISRRGSLESSQSIALTVFDYAESYVCLLVLAALLALATPVFNLGSVTLCLVAAIVIAATCLNWYSNACVSLLEFDIDSFVALRCYDQKTDHFVKPREDVEDLCVAMTRPASSRLLEMLYLRGKPTGPVHLVYALGRGLISWIANRGKLPS